MEKPLRIAVPLELGWPLARHYETLAGVHGYAQAHCNWQLIPNDFVEISLLEQGTHYDGILGRISADCLAAAQPKGIPMVNVMASSKHASQLPSVFCDWFEAGRIMGQHLIARGLQRLCQFGVSDDVTAAAHFEGMLAVANEHGFPCTRHKINDSYWEKPKHWRRFIAKLDKIMADWQPPLGIGVWDDEMAVNIATACEERGWIIPQDIAIVGAGNNPLVCNAVTPTLSSIAPGYYGCGYEAARLLDHLMQGGKPPNGPIIVPPEELVVRRSSDVFAVEDKKVAQALRYMADNCDRPLSVTQIANAVSIGRQTLERRFNRHVGRTINNELIRLRLERLKRLLVETDQPIKMLSPTVGFGTTIHMNRMFKRHTGMTPKVYRAERRRER